MAALRDALDYQQRQATLAELIQHESALVERFALPAAAPLSDADLTLITEFSTWCNQRRVRALPSRPEVVGTFIQEIAHRGPEYVLSMVEAIGRMHMKLPSLSDPTVSRAVHFVLDQIIKTEPPRSWSKEDKLLFMSLPAQIRAVIARREQEREFGLRRKQNELAEEIKKLKQPQTKETDMSKKKQHELLGAFTDDKPGLRQVRIKDNAPGKDISRIVDSNADNHPGGGGKIDNPGSWNRK